jgi:Flp pilus assembly protein TadG
MNRKPLARRGAEAGQSVVELALVLPILVTLALGIFDLSCAIRANNILINVSREGASLALRTTRSSISVEDLMNSLAATAQPLVLAEQGMLYITEVRKISEEQLEIVSQKGWSRNSDKLGTRVTLANAQVDYLGEIPMAIGQSVYIFEAGYLYRPLLLPSVTPALYSATVF